MIDSTLEEFFKKLDVSQITYEICEKIVQENEYNLLYIPDEFKYSELYEIAVRKNFKIVGFIPERFKTPRMRIFSFLFSCDKKLYDTIPYDTEISELYKKVLNIYGITLGYIPKKDRTKELCEIAFHNNKSSFIDIPDKLKTKEICKIAVKHRGFLIGYVPEYLMSVELCKMAMKNDTENIKEIPDHFKTQELCEIAVKHKAKNLEWIPNRLMTPQLCMMAPFSNGNYIPENIKRGYFETDINDFQAVKAYIRFTPGWKQTRRFIETFLLQASIKDINEVGSYINLSLIPNNLYPLLINSSSRKIQNFLKEQLKKIL